MKAFVFAALLASTSLVAQASDAVRNEQLAKQFEVARSLLSKYSEAARKENPKAVFSAEAGRAFYVKKVSKGVHDYSCSSCHSDNPVNDGKHIETGKAIKPLAIYANPDSFSTVAKAEKGFAKHCRELYGNDCSAQDKGNYLTYLISVK